MLSVDELNFLRAKEFIEECIALGIQRFGIAPGARSLPIVRAISENPYADSLIHYDERGLMFWALGISKASQIPVAVVTTSGTAVSNCFPAICEAAHSFIPLFCITADRPPELHHVGANQSMKQCSIFGSYVRFQETIPLSDPNYTSHHMKELLNNAYTASIKSDNPGPVHLNIQIREPLSITIPTQDNHIKTKSNNTHLSSPEKTHITYVGSDQKKLLSPDLEKILSRKSRGLFLVGAVNQKEASVIATLAKTKNIPVIGDIQSGISGESVEDAFISEADWVVVFGYHFVSKERLKQLYENKNQKIFVSPVFNSLDPYAQKKTKVCCDYYNFCMYLEKILPKLTSLSVPIRKNKAKTFTELLIAELSKKITTESVFIGNSSIIRTCDNNWAQSSTNTPQRIFSNRGVSGIDGNIATISGIAFQSRVHTIGMIGDMTFLHDCNSLNLIKKSDVPITLCVINNKGGRIFESFYTYLDKETLVSHFVSPHTCSIKTLSEAFDITSVSVDTSTSVTKLIDTILEPKTKCIEINAMNDASI
jgi:2-succinyl-5-enolpyruvyl-6-hydroxy-3-cyclohexene-1-carboxylate synthase